jgi:hypothetical protein
VLDHTEPVAITAAILFVAVAAAFFTIALAAAISVFVAVTAATCFAIAIVIASQHFQTRDENNWHAICI